MYLEEISIYWLWKRKRLQRVEFSTINIFTSSFILKQRHSKFESQTNYCGEGKGTWNPAAIEHRRSIWVALNVGHRKPEIWKLFVSPIFYHVSSLLIHEAPMKLLEELVSSSSQETFLLQKLKWIWLLFSGVTYPICEIKSCSAKHFARGKDKAKYSRVR